MALRAGHFRAKSAWILLALAAAAPAQQFDSPCDVYASEQFAANARRVGDPETEAKLLLQAWEACPSRVTLLAERSYALSRAHRREEALAAAEQALAHAPSNIGGLLAKANALLMLERWDEVGKTLEIVLRQDPKNAGALKIRANYEYLIGESAAAEQTFLKLLSLEPSNYEAAYMLGRIYYMDNRIEYAMAQFQRVLKLEPRSYKAYDNLGLCYDAQGDHQMAIRHFLTAIKLAEEQKVEYAWPYANLADLLLRRDEAQQAYQAATQAAKRDPYSARSFYLGGKALHKLGRSEDAQRWLERSVGLDPQYAEPLYLLAQIYSKNGDSDKAGETLAKFREVKKSAPRERR
ncbi:MAG: tetratricopeptide repeat protein [Bryobacterales bacterium]